MTSKRDIRTMLRQKEHNGSPAEASAIINRLVSHPRIREAKVVMLYHALPDEVPTRELMTYLIKEGKTVLLPRVISDTDMELHRYTGEKDLRQGAFGIMEPMGELFTDYATIDVAVIPGMAFDRQRHRLGRGKGYYDRFLSQFLTLNSQLYKIGICYPSRLLDEIPVDEHDILMDEVIS